jgi:hypothetical protein
MSAFPVGLHLRRRWWPGHRTVARRAGAPAVAFKDLGALPVCGGSVRPAASQRALAGRRTGQA